MSNDYQPAPHLIDLAQSCVDFVQRSLSLPLDYTQDTLPILDHYLRTARAEAKDPNLLSPLVPAAGAYFGTLLCRQFPDARFVGPEGGDYESYRVQFGSIFLYFNPLGIAQEVLTQSDAPGWNAHFSTLDDQRKVIEQTLTEGLPLREEDYYSFSVRYEMLDQVIAVLLALEEQRKDGPRHFGPEVYATMAGQAATAKS